MNCKPGDLAIVVGRMWISYHGVTVDVVQRGTILRVTRLASLGQDPQWNLEQPITYRARFPPNILATGIIVSISDCVLRPIRDPGDDAVDEMVQRVGTPAAPRVITEGGAP